MIGLGIGLANYDVCMLAIAAQSGWVPYLFFESPGILMTAFAVCFALTRLLGRRTGNKRVLHLSWVSLGLVLAVYAASSIVTTPRETLAQTLDELLLAVEDKRLADVERLIDPDAMTQFQGDEFTRQQLLDRIDSAAFDDVLLLDSSALLDTQQGYGITGLRVNVKGTIADYPGVNVSEWAIRWRHVDDRWVAIRLQCIKFGAEALFHRPDD